MGASPLLLLPDEVWDAIFGHVPPETIIALASTSKDLRDQLVPLIFRHIKGEWSTYANKHPPYPERVVRARIIDCSLYSEWSIDIFGNLAQLPNLRHLLVNTIDLASWLRYRHLPRLTHLTLYHDDIANKTRFFDLNALNRFVCLTSLDIHDYHCLWPEEEMSVVNLSRVKLVGCSWEYPFKLSQFNPGQSLISLEVEYNKSDTFAHSHLVMDFLTRYDENLASVRELVVAIPRSLSPSMFNKITHAFANLRRLSLLKWQVTTPNFAHLYLSKASLHKLTHLTVEIDDEDVEEEVQREYGNLYFSTKFTRNEFTTWDAWLPIRSW